MSWEIVELCKGCINDSGHFIARGRPTLFYCHNCGNYGCVWPLSDIEPKEVCDGEGIAESD